MKACRKCGETKPLDQFHTYIKRDRPRPYTRSECKSCSHAQRCQWGHDNRERDRAVKTKWQREKYQNDPEWRGARLAYRREYERGTPTYAGAKPEGMIDVAPILEAVRASHLSNVEIAARMGMGEDAVRKGLKQDKMALAKAVRILDAIDVLPVEIGL